MIKFIVRFVIFIIIIVILFAGWKTISAKMPRNYTVELESGLSRIEQAQIIGKEFEWDEKEITTFASTQAQMQWAEFNGFFQEVLSSKFSWNEAQKELFLVNSTKYFVDPSLDFSYEVYSPGKYTLTSTLSAAEIAGIIIQRVKDDNSDLKDFISQNLPEDELANLKSFIEQEYELLPDLVPLPPQDIHIDKVDGRIQMSFTTVYYNQGRGPLELRADTKTAGIRKDLERDVFQRIYRPDGTYRDKVAGTFLWHQSHLHYHFADFILYDLEVVEVEGEVPDLSGVLEKSTFCIRDISKIELELENYSEKAAYEICGKEKQGISVGWGDAYFYTYPDQNLNITDIPSGVYRLTFVANPENVFEEVTRDNNNSSVVIRINKDTLKVTVLESTPENIPKFEHIYPVQENCPVCTL